ncbi:MAG: peptide methionine sulfoxide reductase msrA/msrB [Candidatus Paceibacteria bacterium]|jgi:peptide methionine sulfoxide reductase msrA/msrB
MTPSASWNDLTPQQRQVIEQGATEAPGTGRLLNHEESGTYTCARCDSPLFISNSKFDSGCGWPSFDDAIAGAVRELPDTDGQRVEIRCQHCDGHLGHVFRGEGKTEKNTRHCVNSLSIEFEQGSKELAFFAGGCFWGVEHLLQQVEGVSTVDSGYMGGETANPSYRAVCSGNSGHTESVRVSFDPKVVSYETLAKLFFEIHDPTQVDGQGPDIGTQYRSAVFFESPEQEQVIHKLIAHLTEQGNKVATEVAPAGVFWPAEADHQDYLERNPNGHMCHVRVQRF